MHRRGWLRAAVLGANDGIISISGLVLGVAATHAPHPTTLVTGTAGLVAGAIAMAAGEHVSVSSQADLEQADLALERDSLAADGEAERDELAAIYEERGLEPGLAWEVSRQLMARNALAAHARDELGISEMLRARPLQASAASGASFACGAALPLLTAIYAPAPVRVAGYRRKLPSVSCAAGRIRRKARGRTHHDWRDSRPLVGDGRLGRHGFYWESRPRCLLMPAIKGPGEVRGPCFVRPLDDF